MWEQCIHSVKRCIHLAFLKHLCRFDSVDLFDQDLFFQMPTSVEDLEDAIKDEAHSNVVQLVNLWVFEEIFVLDLKFLQSRKRWG